MPAPSSAGARTRFTELLNEMLRYAAALKKILLDERKALESQDTANIEAAIETKGNSVAKLQELDSRRMKLCARNGFATGPEQMQQTIAWCDDGESVAELWEKLLAIAAESSTLNMTNGAIIRVRQQQFESSLSVLRGVTPGADTYGRQGGESSGLGHRSLAQA